jgi:ankyrin repeat protein
VEAVLRTLPATLDETYGRMLDRIGSTDRRDALVLLRWLAYAMRPLTLAELQAAVTIRPEDDDVDFGDEGDLGDSLSILSGLVVFSERVTASDSSIEVDEDASQHVMTAEVGDLDPDTHIRLAHFSVKEYLESTRISASSASLFRLEAGACHRFLSQSCLTYLAFYSKRDKTTSPKLDFFDFNLLNYAATKWYDHSRLQSGDDVSREVALLENIDVRFDWLRIDEIYSGGLGRVQYTIDNIPSMHYAVTCRLPLVVKELLKAGDDVNADWRFCGPLLVAATRGADEALIKVLLAHGANINKTTPDYENALYHAASRGLTLTKLLVDNGADVNLACDRGTALSAACEKGDQSVVRFLFERGARVDINGFRADTPLTIAASRGHKEILEFLIAKGADVDDVNSSADHGTTPLGAAAESGHTDIVAILIDAGADVSAKDNVALFEALRHGDERTVALLEARGAKKLTMEQLNAGLIRSCRSLYHKNPEKAVDLLLDRGADANAEDSSALLGALSCGHEDAVALLEAKGADRPTVQQLNDALIGVCEDRDSTGLERAIQMLLDRGTDVDAWDAALFITLRHGHEDAVALLEAKGANKPTLQQLNDALIELCKNPYCSDFERKIQMLLDRGADINAGDSVLISVLRHGNEDLVALLEAKGAKAPTVQQLHDLLVEARRGLYDDEFGTAVRMLLDRGALDSETSSDAELSSDAGTSSDAETS